MWRDRLRAALATPNDARQANADCAVSAVSYSDQCARETAQSAQTTEGCEGQIVAANLPPDPAANYLTQLRAFCDARAADLAGAFDDPDVLADRQAIAAEGLLPPAETPDRDTNDRHHKANIAGLLAGFRAHREAVRVQGAVAATRATPQDGATHERT